MGENQCFICSFKNNIHPNQEGAMWRLMMIVAMAFAVAGCATMHRNDEEKLKYGAFGVPGGIPVLDHGVQVAEKIATGDIDRPVTVEVTTRQGTMRVNSGYPSYGYGAMPFAGAGGTYDNSRYAESVRLTAERRARIAASRPNLPVLSPGPTVSASAASAASQTEGWTLPECPKDRPDDPEEVLGCHDEEINMLLEGHKKAE